MAKPKVIDLHEPIGEIVKITIREPTGADLKDIGMPGVWVTVPGGGFFQEMPAVYQWVERLADVDPDCLGKLCLRDAIAVRAVVLQFFFDATAPLMAGTSEESPSVHRMN